MLGSMLKVQLIFYSQQHDISTSSVIVACQYEGAFSCEKMVLGKEKVGQRREEEIFDVQMPKICIESI